MGQRAPGQQVEVSIAGNGMAPHHDGRLARRDVPTRRHVRGRVRRAHYTGDGIGRVWEAKRPHMAPGCTSFARARYSSLSRYCSARLRLRMIYVLYPIFAGRALLAEQQLKNSDSPILAHRVPSVLLDLLDLIISRTGYWVTPGCSYTKLSYQLCFGAIFFKIDLPPLLPGAAACKTWYESFVKRHIFDVK